MRWDLGLLGLVVLAAMALAFGGVTQLVAGRPATWRLPIVAAAAYFVCGLVVSEVLFGWATEEELQPNIDGLSFDEVLLIAPIGIGAVLIMKLVRRRRRGPRDAARSARRRPTTLSATHRTRTR